MTHRHTTHGEPMDPRQARYAARAFAEDALRGINRDITQASEEQHNRQAKYHIRAFVEDPLREANRDITQASEKQHIPANLRSRLVDESKRRAFEQHYGPQPHWSIKDTRASTPVEEKKVSAPTNNPLKAVFNLEVAQHQLASKLAAMEAGRSRDERMLSTALNRQSAYDSSDSSDSSDVQGFVVPVPLSMGMEIAVAREHATQRGGSVPVPAQQMPNGLPSAPDHPFTPLLKTRWKASQTPVAPSAPRTPTQSTFDKFDGPRAASNAGYAVQSSSKSAAATPITMPSPPANGLNKFHGHPCNLQTPTAAAKPTTITTPTPPAPEDKDYDKLEGLPFGWCKQVPGRSSDDFHVVSGKVPSAANGSPLHPDTVMDQLDDDLASTLGWDDGDDDTDDEAEWDMGDLSKFKWVGEGSAKVKSTK
jgi:hypothetical protein